MPDQSSQQALCDQVSEAAAQGAPLRIVGANTRSFLGEPLPENCTELCLAEHTGILSYHPAELMLRARAGTTIAEIESLLQAEGQMLAFEPPVYGASTIGGTVATGLSGSRRPYSGAVRDAILGVGLILQDGTYAEFGGQVMKNVAGYDVSRLVCGAFGILGPVVDVSLKVLPRPETEQSIALEMGADAAQKLSAELLQRVSGVSASCFSEGVLNLRFSGSESLVRQETEKLGGVLIDADFWLSVANQSLPILEAGQDLWRLSTNPLEPLGSRPFQMVDWGFGQRWLVDPESDPRQDYDGAGHWTRFRSSAALFEAPVFEPLPEVQLELTSRLKSAFDGQRIFNPGRMYAEL